MPTINLTSKDLAVRVLQELEVIDSHAEPTAQDEADVIRVYRERLAQLAEENEAYWHYDRIPEAAMQGLVMVVKFACAPMFQRQLPVEVDQRGVYLLRKHSRIRPTRESVVGSYF
jgi:hypothetical protein